MGQALTLPVTLTSIDCGQCGGTYAINERYRKQCHDHGRDWTCPYCKTIWGYSGNGRLETLEKELAAEKERREAALRRANESAEAQRKAEIQVKRLKTITRHSDERSAAGVCQCCNRTFKQLVAHMKTKHPTFAAPLTRSAGE